MIDNIASFRFSAFLSLALFPFGRIWSARHGPLANQILNQTGKTLISGLATNSCKRICRKAPLLRSWTSCAGKHCFSQLSATHSIVMFFFSLFLYVLEIYSSDCTAMLNDWRRRLFLLRTGGGSSMAGRLV